MLVQSWSCFAPPYIKDWDSTDYDELVGYDLATLDDAPSAKWFTILENQFSEQEVGPCGKEGYVDSSYNDSIK